MRLNNAKYAGIQTDRQTDRGVVQVSYHLLWRQTDRDEHSHDDLVAGGNHDSESIIIMATDMYTLISIRNRQTDRRTDGRTDRQTETNRQTNKQTLIFVLLGSERFSINNSKSSEEVFDIMLTIIPLNRDQTLQVIAEMSYIYL